MSSDETQRLQERLMHVLELARGVNSSRGLSDLLEACFRGLARALRYDEAYLALEEGDSFRAFFVARDGDRFVMNQEVFRRSEAPLTSLVLDRGHPLLLDDAVDPKTAAEYPSRVYAADPENPVSMRAMLLVPVRAAPLAGVLSVQSREPAVYDLGDLEHLTTLAELICVALKRVRWDEHEAILQDLGRMGHLAADPERFFASLLESATQAFQAAAAEAWELTDGRAVFRSRRGPALLDDERAAELLPKIIHDAAPSALHRKALSNACVEDVLTVPIAVDGLRAVMLIGASRRFTQWDLERATFLRRELIPYASTMVLYRKLAEEAIRDPLTGAFNRRYFLARAEEAISHAARYGHTAAFLVVDLTRFSEVNDTYGHQTGDRVLALVARAFARCMRSTDPLFRIGGDEFVLLLPQGEGGAARTAAERCTRGLSEDPELARFGVGANIGWAVFPTDGQTLDDLLETGDRRMYVAKTAGAAVYDPSQEA